ncbi:TniQ family protein [Streptomyces sp. NPDC057638]|uniref:TniQ family protein n=1 Tax=Streptomyces sp. NPDC057638 TaxID=3346190 RepID=UPI0036CD3D64
MGESSVPRRLPAVLVPVEGESFASWLSRAAADWQLAPGEAALALGLECRPGVVVRPLLFGVTLSRRSLRRAGAATGLGARDLHAMQLARYAGTALELAGLDRPASEPSLAVLGHQEWALFTASRACPKCLAERPVWPLWWRLGIAAVCPVHHVLLVDVCRRCRTRLGQGYNGHPRGLPSRRPEMDLSRCNNRRPAGRQRKAGLCDQKLAALPATPVPAALAALQQRVLDIADGQTEPRVAGRTVPAAEFFAALRFTTAVARLVATDDDLAACSFLPDEAAEAFTAEQHARQRATRGGVGTQMGAVPPAAANAAAALALTEPVLLGPGRRSGSDLLSEWIGRAVARRRTPGKGDPLRAVPRPACLEPLVRAAAPPATRVAGASPPAPLPWSPSPQTICPTSWTPTTTPTCWHPTCRVRPRPAGAVSPPCAWPASWAPRAGSRPPATWPWTRSRPPERPTPWSSGSPTPTRSGTAPNGSPGGTTAAASSTTVPAAGPWPR